MTELAGAKAILTGASRGLGAALAEALGQCGAELALVARSRDELEAVRDRVVSAGGRAVAIAADVGVAEDRARLLWEAADALGPVDILINNAGIECVAEFTELDADAIETMVRVNLLAPLMLVRDLLPSLLERGSGHIVNIASVAGKGGPPFNEPYAATKFGLVGFTQSLRASYAGRGVGFSVVCPGFIGDTGMYARMEADGVRAPRGVGVIPLKKVVDAVLKAIRDDRPELIVNATPIRPLIVLQALFPGLAETFMRRLGITEFFRGVAERRNGAS